MGLLDFLFGKKEKMEQLPTMSGGQLDLLNQLMGGLGGAGGASTQGMNFLTNLLSGDTSKFEAPLMRQFQEEIIPQLSEKFAGLGSGAQSSSAFGQSLGAAGAGLAENLGALRGNLQMQGLGQLSNLLSQTLSQRPFENVYRPATSGFLGGIAPGIGSGMGTGLSLGLMKLLGLGK